MAYLFAAATLVQAMTTFPELVAGEGRACTELMRAMNGRVALKTGAEAVYIAIIPELKLGVAVKIADGATRAAPADNADRQQRVRKSKRSFPELFTRVELLISVRRVNGNRAVEMPEDA